MCLLPVLWWTCVLSSPCPPPSPITALCRVPLPAPLAACSHSKRTATPLCDTHIVTFCVTLRTATPTQAAPPCQAAAGGQAGSSPRCTGAPIPLTPSSWSSGVSWVVRLAAGRMKQTWGGTRRRWVLCYIMLIGLTWLGLYVSYCCIL